MRNFCSITVNNSKIELFSSRAFHPIKGALKGYKDCFFKFVNRGTLVESTPVIHEKRGPNAEVKMTLMDGETLFYAKVDNSCSSFSKCVNYICETQDGYKIRNSIGNVVHEISFPKHNLKYWKRTDGIYTDAYNSLEKAKQDGLVDVYNKLLELERNEREFSEI